MITITIRRGDHSSITVDGHAGYAPRGQDIVCAAVSALVNTLALYFQEHHCGGLTLAPGHATIKWTGHSVAADAVTNSIMSAFDSITKQYPLHVRVIYQDSPTNGQRGATT